MSGREMLSASTVRNSSPRAARRGCRGQSRKQQAGQQEWAEDVGREGELDPIGGVLAPLVESPGVVDEHVEARLTGEKRLGEAMNLGDVRDVADLELDLGSRPRQPRLDPRHRLRAAIVIAYEHVHARTGGGEALAGGLAEPRAAARDQHGPSLQASRDRVIPAQTAKGEPHP